MKIPILLALVGFVILGFASPTFAQQKESTPSEFDTYHPSVTQY
jgi:hypothetical protein